MVIRGISHRTGQPQQNVEQGASLRVAHILARSQTSENITWGVGMFDLREQSLGAKAAPLCTEEGHAVIVTKEVLQCILSPSQCGCSRVNQERKSFVRRQTFCPRNKSYSTGCSGEKSIYLPVDARNLASASRWMDLSDSCVTKDP